MGIAESTIKNKNNKIKNANIKISIFDLTNINHIIVNITIDQLIEPQMRPRIGFKSIYDPLKEYKKIIRIKINEEINKLKNKNLLNKFINENSYIESEITLTAKPPKTFSKLKTLKALKNHIKFNKKPDIDNCIKTIYDSCEGIFFFNDSQIIKETSLKRYDCEESTNIIFYIFQQPNVKGRLTNDLLKNESYDIQQYMEGLK